MMITFQSQAAGDVMMFGDVAKQMLKIIGKEPADAGIVTVAQLPAAIAALKDAIAADRAEEQNTPLPARQKMRRSRTLERICLSVPPNVLSPCWNFSSGR